MRADGQDAKGVRQTALTRRGMVFVAAIAGVFGCASRIKFSSYDSIGRAEIALLAVLSHRESAAEIGKMWLMSWPEMADRRNLLPEIAGDLEMSVVELARAGVDQIRARLSERIQKDFANSRTVRLEGWLLSLAEVRMCALATLSND